MPTYALESQFADNRIVKRESANLLQRCLPYSSVEATIRRGDRGRGPRLPWQIFAATWKSTVKVKPMDGWMEASGPRADSEETSASKGVRRPEPNQGILKLYFRDPAAFRGTRSYFFLHFFLHCRHATKGETDPYRCEDRVSHSHSNNPIRIIQTAIIILKSKWKLLSLHIVRHGAFTRLVVSRGLPPSPAHLHLGDQSRYLLPRRRAPF